MNFEISYLKDQTYQEIDALMLSLRDQKLNHQINNQILVLEHRPVITTGRKNVTEDLLISITELKSKGIDYIHTDRGGKLTYHGPGQLVLYFIFDLNQLSLSIKDWVYKIEEGIIQLLADFQLTGKRDCKNPGVWIEDKKIASIGFHIHHGITTHGISLNVNNSLEVYDYFIPCGIKDRGITSLKEELKKDLAIDQTAKLLIEKYKELLS